MRLLWSHFLEFLSLSSKQMASASRKHPFTARVHAKAEASHFGCIKVYR